ncbi:aromatic amino acid lyase [Branchiibius sp. NY16-3462-2]|uniref:aromatic amino acid lyase n=1 Tax=Branchiibius sp. NY16-3462-2 TaxID=1807500 RepID=UPI0025C64720|nr:aromatic amino acid lyase [Branchiibius sp. NY16-3462-2]
MRTLVPGELDLPGVAAIARREARLELADADRVAIQHAHDEADRISAQRPVYGRTTGVGAQRIAAVADDESQLRRILTSHATTSGAPRSRERVRALLAIRIAQCAGGHGGVPLDVVTRLVQALSDDDLPVIHEGTAIGTGDLAVFAEIGVWLLADRPGLLQAGDALPLISSNAASLADAALGLEQIKELSDAWLAVCALSARATRANPEAFSPHAAAAAPYRGVSVVCEVLTALWPRGRRGARIQDSYSLRTVPHVHGLLLDELDYATFVVQQAIRTGSENPLFADGTVVHHGGFYTNYLRAALRAVANALADAARAATARISAMGQPAVTGRSVFLTDGTPGASGTMPLEFLAATAAAQVAGWDAAYGALSVPLSAGVEEFAPYTSQLAAAMLSGITDLRTLIGAELVTAARALADAADWPDWPELEPLRIVADDRHDRDLTTDVVAATGCLAPLAARITDMRTAGGGGASAPTPP